MRLFFVSMALASSISVAWAQELESSQSFDLKKSIQFALEHAPAFDTLKQQLKVAELEKNSASKKFLPSLDLSATHGLQDSSPRTTGPWGSELSLDLTESLYDNGVSQIGYEIASFKKNQATLFYQERQNKISLDIVTQYLVYSLNVRLLEIQDKQVKLVNKQYELISKFYYQGLKTKNDYLRFKTQVSRYEIDLVNSKNAVAKSRQELQRLIGVDLHSRDNIDFIPLPLGNDNFNQDTNFKIEDHLQYKAAEIQKKINKLEVDYIRKKNLPEIFVSSGLSYGSSQYLGTNQSFNDNDRLNWNALVTLKYNFWDWGVRSNNTEVAVVKNKISSNDLEADLLILKSDINQFVINTNQVKRNYDLAKELLSLEKNNISFIEIEYRNGKIQYLDLIAGLNNLNDAEVKFYSASSDMKLLNYTSLYHQGKLYEELIK